MKKIYTANDLIEANIILDVLENAYIPARLFNVYAQGGTGEIPFTQTYPEVWIMRDLDYEHGQKLITAYQQTPIESATLICPNCREENPYHFQLCWHCNNGLEIVKENLEHEPLSEKH